VILSFSWLFFFILLDLPFFLPFAGFYGFFLLLGDILKFFLAFWCTNCASWGIGFELQNLCFLLSMD
jgi:hypothetical protein